MSSEQYLLRAASRMADCSCAVTPRLSQRKGYKTSLFFIYKYKRNVLDLTLSSILSASPKLGYIGMVVAGRASGIKPWGGMVSSLALISIRSAN